MGRLALLLLVASCGRVGFGSERGSVDGSNDGSIGDGSIDAPPINSAIQYVAPIVQQVTAAGGTDTFQLHALNAGDAIAIMVGCGGSQVPTGVTLTAPGWTFAPASPMQAFKTAQIYAASFVAIAPDTALVTATVTWASGNCNRADTELADEFSGVDPVTPFDAHAEASGGGNCTTTVTTANAGDTVWGGCYSGTMAMGIGSGFQPGGTDGNGDFTEYKLTADPAGTPETVVFLNANGYIVVALTLKAP